MHTFFILSVFLVPRNFFLPLYSSPIKPKPPSFQGLDQCLGSGSGSVGSARFWLPGSGSESASKLIGS